MVISCTLDSMFNTYKFYKPYNCLSQFTREHPDHITLADYLDIPNDCYPIGRLDKDSEGLLLLSNDKSLVNKVLDPKNKFPKTYCVQVDGLITKEAIDTLINGTTITIKKKSYVTKPAIVTKIASPPSFPERTPPIRYRLNVPTSWIKITIIEGKNRQIRRMCASVGFPVLRLIRTKIGDYNLDNLTIGQFIKI